MIRTNRRTLFQIAAASGLSGSLAGNTEGACPPLGGDQIPNPMSPEALSMPRGQISFRDRDLRLFNNRGTTSFRSRTVTGLKAMIFVPFNMSDPQINPPLSLSDSGHFNLSFREEKTGALIQDIQDEFCDPLYLNQKLVGDNTLGPHYAPDKSTLLLLYQDGVWSPETFMRRGTYHRVEGGELISFGMESRVFLSNTDDEIYLELAVENRLDRVLTLTAIPDQPRPGMVRRPCFIREEGDYRIEVTGDAGEADADGWRLVLPPRETAIYRFALSIRKRDQVPETSHYRQDLKAKIELSRAATAALLDMAEQRLAHVQTQNSAFDEFYRRSVLSVLLCRRERENYVVSPFYDLGFSRGGATPWDMAFSSALLAQLDPEGLKGMLLAFFSSGSALAASWLSWQGQPSGWYAQTPFSLFQIVCDYILYTGDEAFLDARAGDVTIFESLKNAAEELTGYIDADGLIDVGPGTGKVLEIRTEGYQHVIPTINALAADFFEDIGGRCKTRRIEGAALYEAIAARMKSAIVARLWNSRTGWFNTRSPDGASETVLSYHVFDMLGTRSTDHAHKMRLVEHLKDGEFLAPFGMTSISQADYIHYDREDCDWGGGGQYVGQPLKVVEQLFRLGLSDAPWNLLKRCLRWVERFPYFPQTIYGDVLELQPHQVDWPLQLSAGAGAQAIIHGVFGFQPQDDGTVIVAPCYDPTLGIAELSQCQFRGRNYRIRLARKGFEVWRDGESIGKSPYRPMHVRTP